MDLGGWLRRLGLEQYEATFRENEIDDTALPSLRAEDLKDLGVGLVGHRRKLLDAIAALRAETSAPTRLSDASPASDKAARDTAERRQVTVMFSDLVDGALCPHGPRGPARDHFGLSDMRRRYRAPLRGLRREIHGRRCAGLFRLSPCTRRRPGASCARRTRDCRCCQRRSKTRPLERSKSRPVRAWCRPLAKRAFQKRRSERAAGGIWSGG